MYHQIRIIDGDKQAQRFLFRTNPEDPPEIYVMDVATFGSTSSPCSAQFVKNRNAQEYAGIYPEAAAAILNRHYVDDYFDSVDTIEQAVKIAEEVKLVHRKGGFEIRNWVSNSLEVLKRLGEHSRVQNVYFSEDASSLNERVLGIIWDPVKDEFFFATNHRTDLLPFLLNEKRPTKRTVLSCVMSYFDPLGLLSPFTIHGRIIVQHLWRNGCEWDDEISDDCWILWKRWTGLLADVAQIRIPRCYIGDAKSTAIKMLEVHVFSDASEHAYGCVAYLRAEIGDEICCTLIMSRTKVAPLKRQSIPRLELMAAVLGAKMSQTLISMHSLKIDRCVLWTDSKTVHSWIRSDQHKFKQFVAFRVGEILENTRASDWRWIPTRMNPADVITKWGEGPHLKSSGEWFTGPSFLYRREEEWPSSEGQLEETHEEARAVVLFHNVIEVERYSRWTTLLRITAYVNRFIENCKRKRKELPILTVKASKKQASLIQDNQAKLKRLPLQKEELVKAEAVLFRQAQFDEFPDEMSHLTKNFSLQSQQKYENVTKSSKIYKLTPILDEMGVLRVGGRMQYAETLPYDKRFPIILPRKHPTTTRLIQSFHEKYAHANRETVVNELRQRFWIPNIRTAIYQAMKACVWCKVYRCKPAVPLMAPLPTQRVEPRARPFSSVGIDYLGPIDVSVGRRKEKRWVVVFTCMAIRAVHIEVVHSLTTQSCLMAIRRFSCRRGAPEEIFSDNATCFRGAENEMLRIHEQCAEKIVNIVTAWHFNPPATPHMGGIWERMVKSVKEALHALDDGRSLTDEVLITTLDEIEDMINTRPLTYMPQENAEEAITPNHFLRCNVKQIDVSVIGVDAAEALRDAFKRTQHLANKAWERWYKEYLPTINARTKWHEDRDSYKVNDLVFVVDGKNRKSWTRGVIEAVHPGVDGRVRQVTVKTTRGSFRRAVANLALPEIRESKSADTGCYGEGRVGSGTSRSYRKSDTNADNNYNNDTNCRDRN